MTVYMRMAPVVGYPHAVCILMLILLSQEMAPTRNGSCTQMISCEPSPHFNCSIKARACDWAVEGKGGAGGFGGGVKKGRREADEETEETEEVRGRGGGRKMEQNHMAWRSCK